MRVLLVIDMQVGCFVGEPPRRDAEGTVVRINALAQAVRATSGLVVFIQHCDASGYAPYSDGWALLPTLDMAPQDLIVAKTACDAFLETDLDSILRARSVDEVIVVGCATDFCVDTTIRSAASRGYSVIAPSDGHTTRDRPHLSAEKIIEHHNYVWTDLLLPKQRRIEVVSVQDLIVEFALSFEKGIHLARPRIS